MQPCLQVCGHKWADLSEYDWGVAVLNDSHYGWSCIDSVLRLSLYVFIFIYIASIAALYQNDKDTVTV